MINTTERDAKFHLSIHDLGAGYIDADDCARQLQDIGLLPRHLRGLARLSIGSAIERNLPLFRLANHSMPLVETAWRNAGYEGEITPAVLRKFICTMSGCLAQHLSLPIDDGEVSYASLLSAPDDYEPEGRFCYGCHYESDSSISLTLERTHSGYIATDLCDIDDYISDLLSESTSTYMNGQIPIYRADITEEEVLCSSICGWCVDTISYVVGGRTFTVSELDIDNDDDLRTTMLRLAYTVDSAINPEEQEDDDAEEAHPEAE